MREFIILSGVDMQMLLNNKPVIVHINNRPFILCTDEYYEEYERGDNENQG